MSPYYVLGNMPDVTSVPSHDSLVVLQGGNYYFHFKEAKVLRAEIPFLVSCSQQAEDLGFKLKNPALHFVLAENQV